MTPTSENGNVLLQITAKTRIKRTEKATKRISFFAIETIRPMSARINKATPNI
jgi:hypothetical protein